MGKLTILLTENASVSLRGELTRWMLEVKPGVFIGTLSATVREKLWEKACQKIKKGGAILIKTMNNEQRFILKFHGNTKRSLIDYDGIQLIKFPVNRKPVKSLSKCSKVKHPASAPKILDYFITRSLAVERKKNEFLFTYAGSSNYPEYTENMLWEQAWKEDTEEISKKILNFVCNCQVLNSKNYLNKKVVSIDIETTDYIPKAYEGFVNIIGIGLLDLTNLSDLDPKLFIFQVFNMLRKRASVPHLIKSIMGYLEAADILIVFNREFDIHILQKLSKEFELSLTFPKVIVDLKERYRSLEELEKQLYYLTQFQRKTTQKGRYTQYYNLFKGKGQKNRRKMIEPIGSYNLMDVLTPLFMYLIES